MNDLDGFLRFIGLINDFQKIKRRVLIRDEEVWENDVEHSYQLALAAWYFISVKQVSLDLHLVIKYALIHDLVEVYAGDTYIYDPDPAVINSKVEREKAAQEQIVREFSEFSDLHGCIEAYETRADKESKFVYALDKILPMINIYLDGGRTWRKESVTLQMLVDHKTDKVAFSPEVAQYFAEFIAMLKNSQLPLFGTETYM